MHPPAWGSSRRAVRGPAGRRAGCGRARGAATRPRPRGTGRRRAPARPPRAATDGSSSTSSDEAGGPGPGSATSTPGRHGPPPEAAPPNGVKDAHGPHAGAPGEGAPGGAAAAGWGGGGAEELAPPEWDRVPLDGSTGKGLAGKVTAGGVALALAGGTAVALWGGKHVLRRQALQTAATVARVAEEKGYAEGGAEPAAASPLPPAAVLPLDVDAKEEVLAEVQAAPGPAGAEEPAMSGGEPGAPGTGSAEGGEGATEEYAWEEYTSESGGDEYKASSDEVATVGLLMADARRAAELADEAAREAASAASNANIAALKSQQAVLAVQRTLAASSGREEDAFALYRLPVEAPPAAPAAVAEAPAPARAESSSLQEAVSSDVEKLAPILKVIFREVKGIVLSVFSFAYWTMRLLVIRGVPLVFRTVSSLLVQGQLQLQMMTEEGPGPYFSKRLEGFDAKVLLEKYDQAKGYAKQGAQAVSDRLNQREQPGPPPPPVVEGASAEEKK